MNVPKQTIKNLKLGSEDAFDEVYYAYNRLIYFILFSIVKQQQKAEDLMQDAFIKMYKNINTLNDISKFHYWFIQIAKNIALNHVRINEPLQINFDEMTYCDPEKDHVDSPVIDDFKDYLTDLEYQIVILKIVHNMTFLQISDLYKKKIGFITRLYYSGIKKIKNVFYKGGRVQ